MNWKIRLQNGWFWAGIIGVIGMIVLYFVPGFDWEPVKNIGMAILTLLAGVGVITDPTTPYVADSKVSSEKTDLNQTAEQVIDERKAA